MKLNKSHFVGVENNMLDKYRDAVALGISSYNYGILPPVAGTGTSFNVSIDIDRNQLLRVNIHELRAITHAGVRIEISEQGRHEYANTKINAEFDLKTMKGKSLYIVLSVNPYSRVAIGEPDPTEVPPRFPYTDFEYAINVVAADDLQQPSNGFYHLCIGKLSISGNNCQLDSDYLPPCTSLRSHPSLFEQYEHLDKVLTRLEIDCITIIQKIFKKEQTNLLAQSVLYLTERVLEYISTSIVQYRWVLKERPPVDMVAYFVAMARIIKNTMDIKTGTGREQMLTYFKDWIVEVNQGEFEQVLEDMINLQYDHNDTAEALAKLDAFYITINVVFNKLSKLDFIGEKKSTAMIVTAEEASVAPQRKKKPSIFID